MDMNSENWSIVPAEAELKMIRRTIRRRSWKTVFTSLLLAAAIFLGGFHFLIPAVEKTYWNPETHTYAPMYSDLEFTLNAYSELFVPGYSVTGVNTAKTGFAAYNLAVACVDSRNGNTFSYFNASLVKDTLTVPYGLWQYAIPGTFYRGDNGVTDPNENVREVLQQLPEYIMVRADITLPKDVPMNRVYLLQDLLRSDNPMVQSGIDWVAIRTCPEGERVYPICGMKPFRDSIGYGLEGDINSSYPEFHLEEISTASLEQHFKSLLRFSMDRAKEGRGLLPEDSIPEENYYETTLRYVEENGVYAYGCTVTATPKQLLFLLNEGHACNLTILDAWIRFYN